MTTRRSFLNRLSGGAAIVALGAHRLVLAQSTSVTPTSALIKQLTLVVPFPPGGGTDVVARIVADGLRGRYAETVIVDNRAGAAGRLGTAHVKSSPSDGSVMLFTPAFPLAIFPHIYQNLPYDALRDFTPVATTSKGAMALSVGPAVPASVTTASDFVAWCKANVDNATYGVPPGSGQHFAADRFARLTGAPLRMVPYKGGAPAVIDVLGGHIACVTTPLSEVATHVADGKLRMLATTTKQRTKFTPNVPTMLELGWDVVFEDWSGVVAPARTPAAIVERANTAINEIVRSPAGIAAMEKLSVEADANSVPAFAKLYRETWERYQAVVKETGFKAED